MNERANRDPFLEQAREDAEGTELLEGPDRDALLERGREEAEGVEVFEDPDATIPRTVLKEGSPGQETLSADSVGLGREDGTDLQSLEED